jgi:hypothetical protein
VIVQPETVFRWHSTTWWRYPTWKGGDDGATPEWQEYIRKYGRKYVPASGSDRLRGRRRGRRPGSCFRNALLLALDDVGLTYVEGLAAAQGDPAIEIVHAWCIDSAGEVIDPTWRPAGASYLGMAVPTSVVTESVLESRRFGPILVDPEVRALLLT